jgi:hypothetical protein
LKEDVIEFLQEMIRRVEAGTIQGVIVYGVGEERGAQFGVVGKVGLDDFAILAVRSQMCAADQMREMERGAKSRAGH